MDRTSGWTETLMRGLGAIVVATGLMSQATAASISPERVTRDGAGEWLALTRAAVADYRQDAYRQSLANAEAAYRSARLNYGDHHANTIAAARTLAFLYQSQGDFDEAETLTAAILRARERDLGANDPRTLASLDDLAFLLHSQGRYEQAEPLYERALNLRRHALGAHHPATIDSLNNLAALYASEGRYHEAEPLFAEILRVRRNRLGDRAPKTMASLHNLALVEAELDHTGEAEQLYQEALDLREDVLGEYHPDTLSTLNNLAVFYDTLQRYEEAAVLYRRAIARIGNVLGEHHPHAIAVRLNYASMLAAEDETTRAVEILRAIAPRLPDWTGSKLDSLQQAELRGQPILTQATFRDVAITLALRRPDPGAFALAAEAVFTSRHPGEIEERMLIRLHDRSRESETRRLAARLLELRGRLARAVHSGDPVDFNVTWDKVERTRAALLDQSARYRAHRSVQDAGLEQVRAALPETAILVELQRYRPVDFAASKVGAARWAALLITPEAAAVAPGIVDLGPEPRVETLRAALNDQRRRAGVEPDAAAKTFYGVLFGAIDKHLKDADRVFISADSPLEKLPFERLVLPDGRFWIQRQDIERLASGRRLLVPRGSRIASPGQNDPGATPGMPGDWSAKSAGLDRLWRVESELHQIFLRRFHEQRLRQTKPDPAAALRRTKLAFIAGDDPVMREPDVWAAYVLPPQRSPTAL